MERREAIAIVVFVIGSILAVACGGARKPCDAPIRSLDGMSSSSAEPAENPASNSE